MNQSASARITGARQPVAKLNDHEREARRLRAEHGSDPLAKLAISLDLQVRRVAHRIATSLQSGAARRHPRSVEGDTPCRS